MPMPNPAGVCAGDMSSTVGIAHPNPAGGLSRIAASVQRIGSGAAISALAWRPVPLGRDDSVNPDPDVAALGEGREWLAVAADDGSITVVLDDRWCTFVAINHPNLLAMAHLPLVSSGICLADLWRCVAHNAPQATAVKHHGQVPHYGWAFPGLPVRHLPSLLLIFWNTPVTEPRTCTVFATQVCLQTWQISGSVAWQGFVTGCEPDHSPHERRGSAGCRMEPRAGQHHPRRGVFKRYRSGEASTLHNFVHGW